MLVIFLLVVVAIIIALVSFAIGYCKYSCQWHGQGSLSIPMLIVIGLTFCGLLLIQNLTLCWFIVIFILGVVFFLAGDNHSFKKTMEEKEKQQKAKEAKQLSREELPILNRVVGVIEDRFGVKIDLIPGKTPLLSIYETQQLGDITGSVELAIGLEDEFGLKISNLDADTWKTVSDVVEYITRRLAEEIPVH